MPGSTSTGPKLGPLPINGTLEQKLRHVKHENDHTAANEAVWIERSRANAARNEAAEAEFFAQLDKRLAGD